MIEGQCLCGAVYYRYHAEIEKTILCFCQHCRRAQGGIMGWNSPVAREHFEVVRGLKYLKEYFHSPNKARVFCQECGSPILFLSARFTRYYSFAFRNCDTRQSSRTM